MPSAFLTGIRNLRSSLLSGALLLASFYILVVTRYSAALDFRPSAKQLVELHASMPLLIAAIAAYVIGSLYVTALEGLVDLVHRRVLYMRPEDAQNRVVRSILGVLVPLSEASRNRLQWEARHFFVENCNPSISPIDEKNDEFVRKVFADILWMEGKLTGSKLLDTYAEYRAEGEFRLSIGLLLPMVALTVSYAAQLGGLWLAILIVVSVLASIQTCNYGLYYFRRAHSFLAHHVSDGSLLTPSMETLKRSRARTTAATL